MKPPAVRRIPAHSQKSAAACAASGEVLAVRCNSCIELPRLRGPIVPHWLVGRIGLGE